MVLPTIVAMSAVEQRVGVEGRIVVVALVVGLVIVSTACTGSGLDLASVPQTSALALVSTTAPAVVSPNAPTSTIGTDPPEKSGSLSAASGRSRLDAAVESGDLCEVNEALEQMVAGSDDGLEVASEMREAADAAETARDVVPDGLRDAWDIVVASTRRYARALVSAGGDASVPEVRAIRSDQAFERASSRLATWIGDHCGDDGS